MRGSSRGFEGPRDDWRARPVSGKRLQTGPSDRKILRDRRPLRDMFCKLFSHFILLTQDISFSSYRSIVFIMKLNLYVTNTNYNHDTIQSILLEYV